MKKINAEIIADSKNEHGQRITTFVLTYPRIIHAELLTHRLFSRNAASSRAIPASKMIRDIQEDPFIPVAFQKAHRGMQGTEYYEGDEASLIRSKWLESGADALFSAKEMDEMGMTKQLVNRILEPYQWYTCIVTATEYDNFFELRCPQYFGNFRSWKDADNFKEHDVKNAREDIPNDLKEWSLLDKLQVNKGAGEIHISLLAEAMWDARNESEPKQLKAGEWHIPFGDNLKNSAKWTNFLIKHTKNRQLYTYSDGTGEVDMLAIKIATARCARVSFLNFEGKDDYEADIKLYDRLLAMGHMSPFEHCARAMTGEEYATHVHTTTDVEHGWSGNFRGFVQLRKEIE